MMGTYAGMPSPAGWGGELLLETDRLSTDSLMTMFQSMGRAYVMDQKGRAREHGE